MAQHSPIPPAAATRLRAGRRSRKLGRLRERIDGILMSVTLRRRGTGDIKVLQDGWSWGCFLGCGFLGLPLFRRGLQQWGSAMVVFNIVALIVAYVHTQRAAALYSWMTLA